ncbi:MAG TPA: 3-keto-5-aminohexanoate cleavage protein [Candidatus Nitrosotenuis sp.]|jgi:3-keto-5-aminohexanoate cleavage enzyme|nr:3-keto-5-aminohexanoate cleavage protein [Candidatus Nitrosotenuis sp.]
MDKLIITCAMVGAEVTREHTPHLPITPEEIAEDARRCREAGAAVVHLHVRDAQGRPSQDPALFAEVQRLIRERTDVIVQFSSGGAVGTPFEERAAPLALRPEMASLTTGTVNFGDEVFENSFPIMRGLAAEMKRHGIKPEIEIFEVGMIENALRLLKEGLLEEPLHFDFVMGVPGGIPARADHLVHMWRLLPPGSTWQVAAVGRHQLPMAMIAMAMGGHVRVGLEDNIYYAKGVLATNAMLVERVARLGRELGREPATPEEARKLLGLPPAQEIGARAEQISHHAR